MRELIDELNDICETEVNMPLSSMTTLRIGGYAKYVVYPNSDIALDSGYDLERGVIASQEELTMRSICPAALNYLKRSGLYNHVISNRRRYTRIRM